MLIRSVGRMRRSGLCLGGVIREAEHLMRCHELAFIMSMARMVWGLNGVDEGEMHPKGKFMRRRLLRM